MIAINNSSETGPGGWRAELRSTTTTTTTAATTTTATTTTTTATTTAATATTTTTTTNTHNNNTNNYGIDNTNHDHTVISIISGISLSFSVSCEALRF